MFSYLSFNDEKKKNHTQIFQFGEKGGVWWKCPNKNCVKDMMCLFLSVQSTLFPVLFIIIFSFMEE